MYIKLFINRTYLKVTIKVLLLLISTLNLLKSDSIFSKISNKNLNLDYRPNSYSFLVGGHTYGAPSPSLFPAASLLFKIREFNEMDLKFMILLGDIIQHQGAKNGIGELEIDIFKITISNILDIPIFNSPGNHDITNRELYEKYFGKTYFHFQNSSELFIILDTELKSGQIEGLQLNYVLDLIKSSSNNKNIKNIFIFMHKTLWAVNNLPINSIDPWVNGPRRGKQNEFEQIILPKLLSISADKNIFIMSGDIGIKDYKLGKFPQESFPLFYHKDEASKITYVASGLAENENDAFIKVDINLDGEVSFNPISLLDKDLGRIDKYGMDYWNSFFSDRTEIVKPKVNIKKKKVSLIKKTLLKIINIGRNKYFIMGNMFMLSLSLLAFLLYKQNIRNR